MKEIFTQGEFRQYRVTTSVFDAAKTASIEASASLGTTKTTIFLSHKHEELNDLMDIMGLLKEYNVEVYIDSADEKMPKKTSDETAKRIKNVIQSSDRFILIATNKAIESKWCNWELGYGDAYKSSKDHIAIFPMKPSPSVSDSEYKGHEYLYIYPRIIYYDGTEKYSDGRSVTKGLYVCTQESLNSNRIIKPLNDWLSK